MAGPSLIVAPTVQKARWSTKREENADKSFVVPSMQMKARVRVLLDLENQPYEKINDTESFKGKRLDTSNPRGRLWTLADSD